MKKIIVLGLCLLILFTGCGNSTSVNNSEENVPVEPVNDVSEEVVVEVEDETAAEVTEEVESVALPYEPTSGQFIEEHGVLSVEGNHLVDQNGEIIQLKGISTHGVHFQGSLINPAVIGTLVNDWGIQVLRGAMYTEEDGYITNPSYNLKKLEDALNYATYYGIYALADWHVLGDKDPLKYLDEAKIFFNDLSLKYANNDNIFYEICNEPNGDEVTWTNNIKPYAEEIIPIIRANDPNAIIIVGTGSWSQDLNDAADDPLDFDNIMYTCHFYAGTHDQWLRDRVQYMMDKDLAVFVTEWGTSTSTGGGGVYVEESDVWLDFLDERHISWSNWSLAALAESSALLVPNASTSGDWPDDKISASGHYIKSRLATYK